MRELEAVVSGVAHREAGRVSVIAVTGEVAVIIAGLSVNEAKSDLPLVTNVEGEVFSGLVDCGDRLESCVITAAAVGENVVARRVDSGIALKRVFSVNALHVSDHSGCGISDDDSLKWPPQ